MADYYNLLGVPRDATVDQIRAAFRKAAKKSHPDAHAQGTPRQQAEAQQRFIQLAQAYETLSHVGLRRVYDEKLKAAEAGAASAKRPAAAKPGPSSAKPPPASERQARADQVRRPSADGERQSRMDEARRATERGAEDRQRREERDRRERERAQHDAREFASRQRRAHAQAQARRTTTYGRPPPDRPLEDIIDDVESLLGRFGLDLRTPVEVVWDTLLTWARRLFRDTEPPEATRPRPKPRPEPSFRAKAEPRQKPPPKPEPSPKPPPRPRSTFRDGAVDAEFRELRDEPTVDQRAEDLELERELADLKRGKRDAPTGTSAKSTSKPSPSPEEEELAELKRRMGKD
jgi:curved DNA-binding protein CbpA